MANWFPILDMDLEDGTHTCYCRCFRGSYVYVTQCCDGTWDVEIKYKGVHGFYTMHKSPTKRAAQIWVLRNIINNW